ncbi:class I SAM-dependent methyltransferase (plasmid) [Acaryochloris sp. 'Moss Beach']|uniref:O-methyltransferase n=1 Tax=Acaryochloris sp. 'Moss Beach' TaxID=2740837 RepID=UPI001F429836|nr:class I SAM-dependent methyltransferase [Acaryochloris sp. 'Moss Beach']UJB72392.1 class I SAM-dependent methyltransferase [Acaryochloris sp. 'Moss Beach']
MNTLDLLYEDASSDKRRLLTAFPKLIFRDLKPSDVRKAYLPINRDQGEFIYDLLISEGSKHIVEFGTSFGISTLFLAAAARQTGGHIVTSELLPEKCAIAQKNFECAGIADLVDLREGNAMDTLASIDDGIDFLLLDGWNDLYLPVLQMVEHKLNKGAYIYTDNASFPGTEPLLSYLRENSRKFESEHMKTGKGGIELTKYLGRA